LAAILRKRRSAFLNPGGSSRKGEIIMAKQNKAMKALFPALGIIFGAAVGLLCSVLYSLNVAGGVIIGGAAGLLSGVVFGNMFGQKD